MRLVAKACKCCVAAVARPGALNAHRPALQEFVNPVEKLVARGGADFSDALASLRARALNRRKATL